MEKINTDNLSAEEREIILTGHETHKKVSAALAKALVYPDSRQKLAHSNQLANEVHAKLKAEKESKLTPEEEAEEAKKREAEFKKQESEQRRQAKGGKDAGPLQMKQPVKTGPDGKEIVEEVIDEEEVQSLFTLYMNKTPQALANIARKANISAEEKEALAMVKKAKEEAKQDDKGGNEGEEKK